MSTGRDKFKSYKGFLIFLSKILRVFPRVIRIFFWNCSANHSQLPFIAFRYVILRSLINQCGDNIRIGTSVQILGWSNLKLGNNISIHANCYIDASGGIVIGNDVSIAHNSTILSSNHDWHDKTTPIKYNPILNQTVTISDDVWIGCGCRILAGVNIETRTIIAAGAVVNKNVKSNTIVGGVPAGIIKTI